MFNYNIESIIDLVAKQSKTVNTTVNIDPFKSQYDLLIDANAILLKSMFGAFVTFNKTITVPPKSK